MSAHALLAPSDAKRWMNCPPSARLTENMPDAGSEYAAEGTLAHALAEITLRNAWTDMDDYTAQTEFHKLSQSPMFSEEMLSSIRTYADAVGQIYYSYPELPHVAIEVRLDCSRWIPGCFGTGDCIIIGNGVLNIIDLKYGKGVAVEAENNPQMMIYALGAINAYEAFYDIDTVCMTICQPRLNSLPSWSIKKTELMDWAESALKPAAERAFKGEGEYCSGAWCRFCKARARCETRTNTAVLEMFKPEKNPLIDNAELARRLAVIAPYVSIYDDLKALALTECLEGRDVPGFKAVEGRATRCWTNGDKALKAAIEAGWDEAVLYKREPLTLAGMEKLMGKKTFGETLGEYIATPPGKPTLVEESDKRAPITKRDPSEMFNIITEVEE